MNLKKVWYASAVCLALTACSDDEGLSTQPNETAGDAYMSLSIEMPNANAGGRAIDESGDGTHAGTEGEQQISNLKVLVYNEEGKAAQVVDFKGNQLVPQKPNPVEPGKATVYTLPAFKVSSVGTKKIVVVVNPLEEKLGENAKANVSFMHTALEMNAENVAAISTPGKFMMTNVNRDEKGNGAVEVTVTNDNDKNNPAVMQVVVERVVAKIEDLTTNYAFNIKDGSGDKVAFTEVALINGNTKFFPIMKVRANGTSGNDYVVDPNFEKQNKETKDEFYANDFTTFPTVDDNKWVQTLDTKKPACFYTLENTMIANEQMNAYTTGLYYKATYQLKDAAENANIYQYGGKLYTWENFKKAAEANGVELGDLTDESSQEEFDKINVKKYVNGVCYYPYWIRHIGESNGEMTPMEFAVVRNNYYQVSINSVKGIGDYKPTTPNPETPDELVESFLNVTVKVLPWIVRKNQIDF